MCYPTDSLLGIESVWIGTPPADRDLSPGEFFVERSSYAPRFSAGGWNLLIEVGRHRPSPQQLEFNVCCFTSSGALRFFGLLNLPLLSRIGHSTSSWRWPSSCWACLSF